MKNKLKCVLPVVIILALLFSFSLTFASVSFAKNRNDYSRPGYSGDVYNETFDTIKFLRDKLGVSVGNVEREYLTETSDFVLSYPKNIPSSYVTLYPAGAQVFVYAKPYSYTNSEGVSVSWVPKRVVSAGNSQILKLGTSGEYEAKLSVSVEPGLVFTVEYSATISVPKEDINLELSRAYLDAKYLDYLEKQLEYEAALEIYNEYLSDKKIYDGLYLEYTEYLSDLENYNAELLRYEKYLAAQEKYEADYVVYIESLKTAEELADEILAYQEYVNKMEKINYRLSLIEDMKVNKTELKRSLYWAIKGDAVDQVLAEEDILTGNVVGADKAVVQGAGDATREIRAFFDQYFALESDLLKYRYYQINYQSFKNNIVKLFQCLENLYENGYVKGIIESKERSEKYEILLAQLYLAANALSDEVIYNYAGTVAFNANYKINTTKGYKTPAEILGNIDGYYVDKNIATPPANEAYPDPVANPNYTPVPEPKKPEKVTKPTLPVEVSEPEEPTLVQKPEAPLAVENENGIAAKAPLLENSLEARLLDAYRKGLLSQRSDKHLKNDFETAVSISVTKVYGAETVTVTYHDYNENPIGDVTVEAGTFAEIEHVPEKSGDEKYSYVFEAWVDEFGSEVDLSSVESDMRIYPRYKEVINKYTVNWQIGDTIVKSETLDYGTELKAWPAEKNGDLNKYYSFSCWTPAISCVTQNITYTAVFEEKYTVPKLADGSIVKSSDTEISVNCGALLGEKLDVSRLLEIAAGKYSVNFQFSLLNLSRTSTDLYAEFKLAYTDVVAMKKNLVTHLEFSILKENGLEQYSVTAYGKNGEPHSTAFKFSASIPSEKNDEDMRVVYYLGEERLYAKSTYSDGRIAFNLNTGCHYSYILEIFPSQISVLPQEIKATVDKMEALPGEIVSVNVNLPQGYELISVYYVAPDGTRVTIGDGEFIMPDFDLSVGVETKKTVYTVNFVSDGMVISSKEYYYGDTVEIPDGVAKASDEKYSYKFKRWSPTVSAVTQDASYQAVYERTPIVKEDDSGLKISEGTLRILITAGVFAVILLCGVIPSLILSVIFIIKRKRRGTSIVNKHKTH